MVPSRLRSWTLEKVRGDDRYDREPLPALNAMRAAGQLPGPREVCDTKPNVGQGHRIVVRAEGVTPGLYRCTVYDHDEPMLVVMAQDNGVVS